MGSISSLQDLDSSLADAFARYTKENAESERLHVTSCHHLPGGNTRTVLHAAPFPLTFESGSGSKLTSVDGRTYIDLLNEYSAGVFGHSNPKILSAVHNALSKGWNFGGQSRYEKIFAEKVVQRFRPAGMDLVRFTNSGTEANMMALAAAIAFTGRKKILVFSSGYHGGTLIFPMELIKNKNMLSSNLPHEFIYAPYNNIDETRIILAGINTQSLAAIMVEPVQGSGGARPASKAFLSFLRTVADETGALLIADEVMTSRLGVSGRMAVDGIKPDMLTLGKYVAGGMTFGAFGGRRDVMELFDPAKSKLLHPGTYNNNVISMAAGIEGLDIFNAEQVERLNVLGTKFCRDLRNLIADYGILSKDFLQVQETIEMDSFSNPSQLILASSAGQIPKPLPRMFVSGYGSMVNIRFSEPESSKWHSLFYHHMLTAGFYIAPRGYITMSLELEQRDLDEFLSGVNEFLAKYATALMG